MEKLLKLGLSIDFDYWSFEDPAWDFGHSEVNPLFKTSSMWAVRYLHIDLIKETALDKTDFHPNEIIKQLKLKGLNIVNGITLAMADSHRHAYDFFSKNGAEIDAILHIDAHHDCWPYEEKNKPDCGNWLTALGKEVNWIIPKWKNIEADAAPSISINKYLWDSFQLDIPNVIVAAFICRSSAWVPPHLDEVYAEFAETMSENFYPQVIESVVPREDLNYRALAIEREKLQAKFNKNIINKD
jgi:hypothetical protein